MKYPPNKNTAAFTWVEFSVLLGILGILLFFTLPRGGCLARAKGTQILSNMRQLHVATQQMTLDNATLGKPIRFTCSGDTPIAYKQWIDCLAPEYLSTNDLKKLLSWKDPDAWTKRIVDNAITIFAVTENDSETTLFSTTKNWHPGAEKLFGQQPVGTKEFVVFRKGGDGQILQARQASQTDLIGTGGLHNYLPLNGNE